MKQNNVSELIKLSLWGNGNPTVDWSVYQEMKSQAIASLAAPILSSIDLPVELKNEWKNAILQQVASFSYYKYVQSQLPIDKPYAILKGTSAAQYYPYPEYRTMGDIDIITKREDYDSSCETMIKNSWYETTSAIDLERGRHRSFVKGNITVEIHAFFASMNDVEKAKTFDDIIINNITDTHILPDLVNGLVLIDHVNQHMEEGIGLRQIIDWMMFVDKCLTDDKWAEFEKMATLTGLKELTVTTTRMCEMYLGLPAHKWCISADEKLSRSLMEYVMECGNFGAKLNQMDALSVSRLYQLRHPIRTIKGLQQKECENLVNAKKSTLQVFGWIKKCGKRVVEIPNMLVKYRTARKVNSLFKSLGIARATEGLVFYKEGRYFKKK